MTPEQLEDILIKADDVHDTKLVYEGAMAANNTAIANGNAAKASWLSAVNAGADETTLTNLLNNHISASVAKTESDAALVAAQQPYGAALDAMSIAVDAVINEEINS
jgi:hypothetical protein